MTIAEQISHKSGVELAPCRVEHLEWLRWIGIPSEALDFYQWSMPTKTAEIGKVRLCSAGEIYFENRDQCLPGSYANPNGYIIFATTVYGDAFCFDTRSESGARTPIVLIAHDLEPEGEEMSREKLARLAKPISETFAGFLASLVAEKLDIEPLYPPFDPPSF